MVTTMIAPELLLALLVLGPAAGVDFGPPRDAEPVAGPGLRGPPFLLTAPPPQWETTPGVEWGTAEGGDGLTAPTTERREMAQEEGQEEGPEEGQEEGPEAERAQGGDADEVRFLLYTRARGRQAQELRNLSARGTDWEPSLESFFLIHGFTGDASADSVALIRDALLGTSGWACNVVAVQWRGLAAGPHYARAANNTRVVAVRLAALLRSLADQGLLHGSRSHLIGFSLGAQVAGQAGLLVGAESPAFPARLTALDPARPAFADAPADSRLGRGSAAFVAVLHCAGGVVAFEQPMGHVDFFPNGGRSPQPPCRGRAVHVVCSHLLAPRYLAEAIRRPGAFRAVRCSSWRDFQSGLCAGGQPALLGVRTNDSLRGSFFLRTNAEEPYGRGDAGDELLLATTTEHNHNHSSSSCSAATPLARALALALVLLPLAAAAAR